MSSIYLSDSNDDFRILENYLASGEFGILEGALKHLEHQNLEMMKQVMASVLHAMPDIASSKDVDDFVTKIPLEIPTKYDSPLAYQLLNGLIQKIKDAAAGIGLDISTFPHYSSIPTKQVNACAVRLPGATKPFLLFDSEILMFCHLFSKAFAQSIPITGVGERIAFSVDMEKVRIHVRSNPYVLDRITEILASYEKSGVATNAEPFALGKHHLPMADLIRQGMELFVVGHEFGHVYAGHVGKLKVGEKLQILGKQGNNKAHLREHEADFLGMVLTLKAMAPGFDVAMSYLGIDLLFVSLDLADRYAHLEAGKNPQEFISLASDDHPSNLDRRLLLRQMLSEVIDDPERVTTAIKLASSYEAIADHLWESIVKSYDSAKSNFG